MSWPNAVRVTARTRLAGRAGVDARARLGPAAAAALAGVDEVIGDLDGGAAGGLLQRDLHLDADVATLDAARGRTPAEGAKRVAPEERVEDVREGPEAVRRRVEAARVEPLEAVAVVGGAPLGIGQDLVGLSGLLELLLGLGVVPVHVRVKLACEPAEGLLDIGVAGVPGDPEHLVGVAPHSSYTSATKRDNSRAASRTAPIATG